MPSIDKIRWLPFRCSAVVPAFGVLVSDPANGGYEEESGGGVVLRLRQATADDLPAKILFVNGPSIYSPSGTVCGSCAILADVPFFALCDDLDPPGIGDRLAPEAGSWEVVTNEDGPLLALADGDSDGRILVVRHPGGGSSRKQYQLHESLIPGSTVDAYEVAQDGTIDTTGDPVTLTDTLDGHWGLEGETIEAESRTIEGTETLVVLTSGRERHEAQLQASLSGGASNHANCHVTTDYGTADVEAYGTWIPTGKTLATGTVKIEWSGSQWEVVQATACPT